MLKKISPPPHFSFIKKGKLSLLVRENYKRWVLDYCENNIKKLHPSRKRHNSYFAGRKLYPVIPFPEGQRVVIRPYSHGGLLRFFTRDLFLSGTRSFDELILNEEIRLSEIPTVTPVAAVHQVLIPPFYRPYLLTLEIPGALNLVQYFEEGGPRPIGEALLHKRKTIRSAGLLLKKFHQAGFYHGDLQLKNFLVLNDQVFLIDFDRSYRKPSLTSKERMKNLLRLNRSVDKWKEFGLPLSRTDRLRFLYAYAGKETTLFEEVKKALRFYSVFLFFHRLLWKIQKVLKKLRRGSLRSWT